jgi:hypothetical protein
MVTTFLVGLVILALILLPPPPPPGKRFPGDWMPF